jgi:multidrug efflux system membrane fusion protein
VNGETVKGTVRYISRDASPATRTFRVEVAIPNPIKAHTGRHDGGDHLRGAADSVVLPRSVVTLSDNGDLGIRAVDKVQGRRSSDRSGRRLHRRPGARRHSGRRAVIVAGQDLVTEGDDGQRRRSRPRQPSRS